MALVPTFIDGFLYNHTNVRYYNISSRVDFQDVGLKNPGHCEYFLGKKKKKKKKKKKNFVIALVPTFFSGF